MSDRDLTLDSLAQEVLDTALCSFRARSRAERPVWEDPGPLLAMALAGAHGELPHTGAPLQGIVSFLVDRVLERPVGNTDPRFLGWVHGGGDELGLLAAIVVAGMNANTGGRDHGAVRIERVVLDWMRSIFGFPTGASSVFTQGTSEANLLALATARTSSRSRAGSADDPRAEAVYVSARGHESVFKTARILQFGHIRIVPERQEGDGLIDVELLERCISEDRAAGLVPVCIVATAGTVDRGATDDLDGLAEVAASAGVWLHVDGAFGAWLRIAPRPFDAPVRSIDRADSLAFDLHKWLPVPFATGVLLVADRQSHRATFAVSAQYLAPSEGLAGGPDWAANYGIALSRPFQGLAAYLILRAHGLRALGERIAYCVVLADYFGDLVRRTSGLRLIEPVEGNVVLFEVLDGRGGPLPADRIAAALQSTGRTVFSTTSFGGRRVLRACFVNHRTRPRHAQTAIEELLSDRASWISEEPLDD
jgi:aromatic-L-amino-acid/L-tryptophan decarboxylase